MAAEVRTNGLVKPTTLGRRPYAYVTFLAGDGEYVKGVVGLAKALRKVKSAYPLMVSVLPNVPKQHCRLLRDQGCIVRDIEPLYPHRNGNQFEYARAYYSINYSKLRIWQFEEYRKMVYLDADILVNGNIDHLFDLPDGRFYAVPDCSCENAWSQTPQYKIRYGQQCPINVGCLTNGGVVERPALGCLTNGGVVERPALYFNGGMFVFEPSKVTYETILKTLEVTPTTLFAEQDFLNVFFRDIYTPISPTYNLLVVMLWNHPDIIDDVENIKVVHYCINESKPWKYTGMEENMKREDVKLLVRKWWETYTDPSLDIKITDSILIPKNGFHPPQSPSRCYLNCEPV